MMEAFEIAETVVRVVCEFARAVFEPVVIVLLVGIYQRLKR